MSSVSVMLNTPCSGLLVYENNTFLYCFFEFFTYLCCFMGNILLGLDNQCQNVLTSGLFVAVNGLLVDYNPNKR